MGNVTIIFTEEEIELLELAIYCVFNNEGTNISHEEYENILIKLGIKR